MTPQSRIVQRRRNQANAKLRVSWVCVMGLRKRDPPIIRAHPPGDIPPEIFPSWTLPPPFYMMQYISPFYHHYPPIYNIKRSTVNVYKIDRGSSVFALKAGRKCPSGEANCPGGTVRGNICPRGEMSVEKCPTFEKTYVSTTFLRNLLLQYIY